MPVIKKEIKIPYGRNCLNSRQPICDFFVESFEYYGNKFFIDRCSLFDGTPLDKLKKCPACLEACGLKSGE